MGNKYNVTKDGAVIAVRIYFVEGSSNSKADLVLAHGGKVTIDWATEQRKPYEKGITGYTLFYDERPKRKFEEWGR